MDKFCPYTFAIKQLLCQGGINKRLDNTYINTAVGTEIPLSFGYVLTLIAGTCKNSTIMLTNPIYIPNINFIILNESFKIFDLPCECGTYRLHIAARLAPVETFCSVN
ncbi:MAG: hypothetical protein PHD15_03530 [Clostridia bacterium]|nr:hypothetical protein [Clostridia bacterium]MDD4386813.1 hypothetical protein [Clostridia bacterium]